MSFKLLSKLALPEYRDRHIFTAKLRLVIFIGFVSLYIYFFHGVLGQLQIVTGIIASSFILTTLSYYMVLRNRLIAMAIAFELIADLLSMTTIIYIADGPYSDFFTIYLFYIFVAGIFYNYFLAMLIAVACGIFYGGFILLCQFQVIAPLIFDWGDQIPIESHSPGYHFFFWAVFAFLVVYGVKVASYFSQKRERMLEARNKELTALAHMSSTIRSTISVEKVLEQILQGLEAGLDLELPLLVIFDHTANKIRCLFSKEHPKVKKIMSLMGERATGLSMPLDVPENSALQAIRSHHIIFRKNLDEVLIGMDPPLPKTLLIQIQQVIGFKKMVAVPLVAEEELLGALVGFTRMARVEPQVVKTLESFANQAALTLEAALLINRLREANVNLKEANRVKSEFLATMSHELRTPLTAIIGFSELLLEGVMGQLTEEQSESLREVLNNGATLLDLINNLLDMAKVEAGKMTLEIQPFDMPDLLQRLIQTISSLIQRKKHDLKLHLPESLPPIAADEKKIQQILLNLLSNAIKFTAEGGAIDIDLKYHTGAKWWERVPWGSRLHDLSFYETGAFELSVSDSGIGIKPENVSKVFEMFSQGDSSVTRVHGGTGLGLTLAKQFVELHHGLIWVESEYGKGSKFTIVLPQIVLET
ncbi:MAG: HAMP domain-containing sensor histidine kinase [Deltaproteobacteria bacterium]|nr:HAMP domain-containing sensor histidine kinase [Deltaproteobacteria bacterium]